MEREIERECRRAGERERERDTNERRERRYNISIFVGS